MPYNYITTWLAIGHNYIIILIINTHDGMFIYIEYLNLNT